ncbi:hypothetical protein [Cerasicoccus frondis]|uniref:hypothetical protein n=1 Tax=Cerasicoccus frondis TaxID=490090 RepID=UPI0028528546|nr:hypothetical protein [Cerasicoccus frondis]
MISPLVRIWILCLALSLTLGALDARTWTNQDGRTFEGEFVRINGENVTILRYADNREFTISTTILSEADQEFLREKTAPKPSVNPFADFKDFETERTEQSADPATDAQLSDDPQERLARIQEALRSLTDNNSEDAEYYADELKKQFSGENVDLLIERTRKFALLGLIAVAIFILWDVLLVYLVGKFFDIARWSVFRSIIWQMLHWLLTLLLISGVTFACAALLPYLGVTWDPEDLPTLAQTNPKAPLLFLSLYLLGFTVALKIHSIFLKLPVWKTMLFLVAAMFGVTLAWVLTVAIFVGIFLVFGPTGLV